MDQHDPDYIENQLEAHITDPLTNRASGLLQRLLQKLRSQFDPNKPLSLSTKKSRTTASPNLYNGWGGIVDALFLHREKFPEIDFGTLADKMILAAREDKAMQFAGYYMGLGGVLIIASKIWKTQGQTQKVEQAGKEIITLAKECFTKSLEFHELLYGTASVLYSVLCISKQVHCDQLILDLIKHIVDAGNTSYRSDRAGEPFRLVYYFYESEYLGAAHGLAGVIHILLQAIMHLSNNPAFKPQITSNILDPIYNSINFLLHLQSPNGNFPSSVKDYHIKYLQSDRSTAYKAPKQRTKG